MAVLLKNRDEDIFLESYNGVTGEIKFTTDVKHGKNYLNDWFAKAELEYLQFHFPEETKDMIIYFT